MKFSNKDIEIHSNKTIKALKQFNIPTAEFFKNSSAYKIRNEMNKMTSDFSYGNIILKNDYEIRKTIAYYKAILLKTLQIKDETFTFSNEESSLAFNEKAETVIDQLTVFEQNKKSVH